jgi:hypothetical protein
VNASAARKVNMRSLLVRSATTVAMVALMGLVAPTASVKHFSPQSGFTTATPTTILHPTMAQDGRWKLGGDGSCYFDPDDSGPDQCSQTEGRWKLGGDGSCYWDPADSGPNQCEPATTNGIEATDGNAGVSAQLRSAEFHSRI